MNQAKAPTKNAKAIKRYLQHIGRAQNAMFFIEQYLDDHGEVAPDDVNWAHVGDMGHVADKLEELLQFIS